MPGQRKVSDVNAVTTNSLRLWALLLLAPIAGPGLACGFFGEPGTDDYDDTDSDPQVPDSEPPPELPPEEPIPTEQPFEGSCVPEHWRGPEVAPGVPTTLSLTGSQVVIDGADPDVRQIFAPLSLELSANGAQPLLAFEDATIDGGATGLVVVVGASIAADEGAFFDAGVLAPAFEANGVSLDLPVGVDDGYRPDLGPNANPDHQLALDATAPVDLPIEGLRISGYEAAYVITDTETLDLVGPFSVSADRMYWPTSSTVIADSIEAQYAGEVFVGMEPIDGEASTEDGALPGLPAAILARDAHVIVGPDHLETVDPMPVRQAIDGDGVLVSSVVELRRCVPETLYFEPGATRSLRFAYRQSDGLSDAVFANVVVEADAQAEPWEVRIELDAALPGQLTDAAQEHPDYSWGQLIVDYVEFWADFTEAFVKGLTCVFTLGFVCDDGNDGPPPLVDYPAWMTPGDVGEFELEIQAPTEIGEYEATVRILGENYESSVPIRVVVRTTQ